MRVCIVAAEVTPFAKTGGLGDVTSALALYLHRAGHDVRLFLPRYAQIDAAGFEIGAVGFLREIPVRLGPGTLRFSGAWTLLPGSDLEVHLVDCPELYARDGIYRDDGDEHIRMGFLTRAALECCQRMGWSPDVLHCHDWHTALGPLYLRTLYRWDGLFSGTRSVLTLHNVGYQGVFSAGVLDDLDLLGYADWFDRRELEEGRVNFLETGILHADVLTTVSPTHALEIQTDDYGMGLQDLLRARSGELFGILNGVDYGVWDPSVDELIPARYSQDDLSGKAECKLRLLEKLGLPTDPGAPLVGLVSRLVRQKGIDLLRDSMPYLLSRRDFRFVALGSGETSYEQLLHWLQTEFPDRVVFWRGFNNALAHQIEAGSDLFLMPSLYEPCGLNQMYSLRYGTPPVVRRTGGLADAVEPFDPDTGEGTGFLFDPFSADGLAWALEGALDVYEDQDLWRRLMRNGMSRDFSWEKQIGLYLEIYRALL